MTYYRIPDGPCATEIVFEMIGKKWKASILHVCSISPASFASVKTSLPDIAEGTLVKQINSLISEGLIAKTIAQNKSLYSITSKGKDIMPILVQLHHWILQCYPSVSADQCSVELANETIGCKWVTRILFLLEHVGTMRFNELQRSIEGITHKVLTEQLKKLETMNLILRKDFTGKIPHVEYTLTEVGMEAAHITDAISIWCRKYHLISIDATVSDLITD